jgi:hypothetical protein
MNRIRPGLVPTFAAAPKHYLEEKANVGAYLEACRKLGVPDADMFTPLDLSEKKADLNQARSRPLRSPRLCADRPRRRSCRTSTRSIGKCRRCASSSPDSASATTRPSPIKSGTPRCCSLTRAPSTSRSRAVLA